MIKIELTLDPTNPAVMAAMGALFLAMAGEKFSPAELIKAPAEKTVKATKETFKSPEPTTLEEVKQAIIDGPADESADEKKDPTLEQDQKQAEGPTLQEVRDMLGKKVADYRDAIKAQLTKMEAKNVSLLDAKHYPEFFNFLTALGS